MIEFIVMGLIALVTTIYHFSNALCILCAIRRIEMNRLTKKHHDDTTNTIDTFSIKEINWCDSTMENWDSAYTGEPIDKLSEYEDIGLTPDEIKYFLKDFGISLLTENRALKKRHEEDEEIINKMAKRLKSFEENTFNSGWIPVSERLPEEYGCYMVAWRPINSNAENNLKIAGVPHFYEILEFDPDDESLWISSIQQCKEYEILAWQPLPEPYKEELL